MRTIRGFGIVLVLLGIAGGVVGETKADGTKVVKGPIAGTFLITRIDINNDGEAAIWFTQENETSFGRSTTQGVAEQIPGGPTPECPGGVFIIDAPNGAGFGASTETFPNGKDQIYSQFVTRTLCADGVGGFSAEQTGDIVGGAGRFEGVTGTFELSFSGFFQAFDPDAVPLAAFGAYTGKRRFEINFPDRRHHD